MMKGISIHSKFILTLLILAAAQLGLMAQDGIGDQNVVIIKDAEVKIANANKMDFGPSIPQEEQTKAPQDYDAPQRLIDVDYSPAPVNPVAIAPEKKPRTRNSFIKLGFGNLLSPLVEISYNDDPSENFTYGAYYNHFSARGSLDNQRFNENDAGIYMNSFFKRSELGAHFDFDQDIHYYYGYTQLPNFSDSIEVDKDTIKQNVKVYEGGLSINSLNKKKGKKRIDINQDFNFYHLSDASKKKENSLTSNSYFELEFNRDQFVFGRLDLDFGNFKDFADSSHNRGIYSLGGGYMYDNNDIKLKASVKGTIDRNKFDLFHNFYIEKHLFQDYLIFEAQFERDLVKNSYRHMIDENPWLAEDVVLANSKVMDLNAAFKGTVKDFSYNLKLYNKRIKNLPLYVNDMADMTRFDVVYDTTANIYGFHAELGYDVGDKLRIGLHGDYIDYSLENEDEAWHLPNVKLGLSGTYNLKDKFLVSAEVFNHMGMQARMADASVVTLDPIIDVNLGIDYRFSPQLGFFLDLNNIANQKKESYYLYPSYGFHGVVGAKFSY